MACFIFIVGGEDRKIFIEVARKEELGGVDRELSHHLVRGLLPLSPTFVMIGVSKIERLHVPKVKVP